MDESTPAGAPDQIQLPPGWRMHAQFERHNEATLALSDVLESALPATRNRDSIEAVVGDTRLQAMPGGALRKLRAYLGRLTDGSDESEVEIRLGGLVDEFGREDWFGAAFEGLVGILNRKRREPLLLGSLLISTVASFEAFMSGVFEYYYDIRPEALRNVPRDQEKEFSLAELQSLSTIEEAVELAISRRIDGLMFGGNLLSWNKFLKDNLKIDMADLAADWMSVREIFERRHVLAHQGGIPGTRYGNFVRNELRKSFDEEAGRLDPSEEYVRASMQSLYSLSVLIGAEVSAKLEPESQFVVQDLQDACYTALVHKQYDVALHLANKSAPFADSDSSRWTLRVNGALALKGMGRRDEAIALVDAWDTSAAAPLYVMARAALRDDLDEVFALLPTVITQRKLTIYNILEWPLLEKASDDSRMEPIRKGLQKQLAASATGYCYNTSTKRVHRQDCRFAQGNDLIGPDPHEWPEGATPCARCMKGLVLEDVGIGQESAEPWPHGLIGD